MQNFAISLTIMFLNHNFIYKKSCKAGDVNEDTVDVIVDSLDLCSDYLNSNAHGPSAAAYWFSNLVLLCFNLSVSAELWALPLWELKAPIW